MFQEKVTNGSRVAIISANQPEGPFWTCLYVNHGEDITSLRKTSQTLKGARKQAAEMVSQ